MLYSCLIHISRIHITQNSSATTSWLDLIACPQLFSKIKILNGDPLHDHIPMYCDIAIPCINSKTNLQDQHSEKYHIKLNNISDDQKTLYSDNLDELTTEIWAAVLSCYLLFCDDHSHQRQLDYIYSTLVESLNVQLFLLIKGLKIVADKSLDGIVTAETCMLMAGNIF